MKIKNGIKEPLLSDILANMEQEQEQEITPSLLDLLPPVDDFELENSLPNIDVNLFLGENDNYIPVNLGADDVANLSSDDSNDGFRKLFHSDSNELSQLPSPKKSKDLRKKLHNSPSLQRFSDGSETSMQEENGELSTPEEKSSQNYTFYIASTKGKRGRKRKNPEYDKVKETEQKTGLKIVIKRKSPENKTCDSSADEKYSLPASKSDASSPEASFPFGSWSDSFTTSIGELVKTRRRGISASLDIESSTSIKSDDEKKPKKLKNKVESTVQGKSNWKNEKPVVSPMNSSNPVNQSNIKANQNVPLRTERKTLQNNSKEQSSDLNMISKSSQRVNLVPQTGAVNNTKNFVSKTKSIVNTKMSPPKLYFHDYSKLRLPSHLKNAVKKEHNSLNSLNPTNQKTLELRSGSILSPTKRSSQRFPPEHRTSLHKEESFDVPLSTAEIEISSYEDITSDSKPLYFNKLPLDFPPASDSPIKKPFVLKSPLNRNKVLSSENLKSRHYSEESTTSSFGYQSTDSQSSSPIETSNVLDRFRKSASKSGSQTSPPPGVTCQSKSSSVCDNFDYNTQRVKDENGLFPSSAKFRSRSNNSKSVKNENASFFTPRPSTRSQTLSPEKLNHQSNSKSRRETDQRLRNGNEKEAEIETRRVTFDNRKAIKERRVMYVGNVPNGYSHETLREMFSCFGEIENVQIKIREGEVQNECGSIFDHEYCDWNASNWKNSEKGKRIYGFVTFKSQSDVAKAIENGKHMWPELNLNYGGRRQFVKEDYSDLDGNFAEKEHHVGNFRRNDDFDFAKELKAAQQRRGLACHTFGSNC